MAGTKRMQSEREMNLACRLACRPSIQAQIEDGHGMAERVSRSVRRLDDIQMRVQRALALVEDVINLRGCAEVSSAGWRGRVKFACLPLPRIGFRDKSRCA